MLAAAAIGKAARPRRITRWWLRMTALMGVVGRRLPCDRGRAQHGRLAELDPEPPGGPAAARAAFLYRAGSGRPRRARASRRTIPMTERVTSGRYPGYDVMSKRESQSWNDKTREVIDARLATEPRPDFLFGRRMENPRGALRPRHAATRRSPARAACGLCRPAASGRQDERLSLRRYASTGRSVEARVGGIGRGVSPDAWAAFRVPDRAGSGRDARPNGRGVIRGRRHARNAVQNLLEFACDPRRRRSLLRPPYGVERDRVWRPRFAARLCSAWASTGATRGNQRRPRRAWKSSAARENKHVR